MHIAWPPRVACIATLLAGLCSAVPWEYQNDPQRWWYVPQLVFDALPLAGNSTHHEGWSGSYWPNKNGGLAHRWAMGLNTPSFDYPLHTIEELRFMPVEELKRLSPAEKYDIYNNRLDYPTVHSEWKRTSPKDPDWYGLCHGWAPAATLYDQPDPVTLKGENGIAVPFAASDVEGLLTYFLAMYRSFSLRMVGTRCEGNATDPNCQQDVNAGTLFVILANEIGQRGNMLVMDVEPGKEVWNQPVSGYRCTKQTLDSSDRVQLTCSMRYVVETGQTWFRQVTQYATEQYKFVLDIKGGSIVGGTYLPGTNTRHPDFIWGVQTPPVFSGYMAKLEHIYKASIKNETEETHTPTPTPVPSPDTTVWVPPTPSPSPYSWSPTTYAPPPDYGWYAAPSPSPPSPSPAWTGSSGGTWPGSSGTGTTVGSTGVADGTLTPTYVYNSASSAWELRYTFTRNNPALASVDWRVTGTTATYGGNTYMYDASITRWVLHHYGTGPAPASRVDTAADVATSDRSVPSRPAPAPQPTVPRRVMYTTAIFDADIVDDVPGLSIYTAEEEAKCRPLELLEVLCDVPEEDGEWVQEDAGIVECRRDVSFKPSEAGAPCAMWKIHCPAGYTALNVTFSKLSIAPTKTEVKVYEAFDGPLLRALTAARVAESGLPIALRVAAPAVRVVLETRPGASASELLEFSAVCTR